MNKQSLIAALKTVWDATDERDIPKIFERLEEALTLANQLEENVGVDERQEFEKWADNQGWDKSAVLCSIHT